MVRTAPPAEPTIFKVLAQKILDQTVNCGEEPPTSGNTDVQLFHESGCRLVHRYRINKDPMPHVSLRGKVVRNFIMFVNRVMTISQLTHLHLSIPSSGTTSEPLPPDCFPVVPLPRKPIKSVKVSFAKDVEVIGSPPTLPSLGEEPDYPDQSLPNNVLNHDQDIFAIAPPTYVLFPFVDPSDDEDMLSPPRFPYLSAPPGFAPIGQPGALPGPAGIASWDWSSFIRPESPSKSQ